MSDSFIQLKDVDVTNPYQSDVLEIEGVNWALQPGQFWMLGGAQNSGKSSLISILAGLQQAHAGEALLFGESLKMSSEHEFIPTKSRVATVLDQGGRIFHQLTVWENLALPLQYHRDWDEQQITLQVQDLLARGGLQGFARSSPTSLNLLLKQRVAILRATALEPDVLILDKPLLEPGSNWVQDFVQEWVATGYGRKRPGIVVVATDNLPEWEPLATHVALIKNKRLVVAGELQTYLAQKPAFLKDFSPERL
ncbi:MAG: Fe(3+)-transporting ATPase [Verrucomicrobiales bacterium]|jgi:ABC-type transporter Mla maintaining outer membrane lipid asymmetry ATPase subunit MlaF|nr:Fe(3+)-transporting ATPase [Verrucomicrobiales bacterium]